VTVEFKKSTTDITSDVYISIRAFSNREGGHIFLGVKDNGEILGVMNEHVDKVKKDFVAAMNNRNIINPSISKVFREIGLADELGSGMRNTYKYTKLYSQAEPTFSEGDIFKIVVHLNGAATAVVGPTKFPKSHVDTLDDTLELRMLTLVKRNPRINQLELSKQLGISLTTIKRTMTNLVAKNILERKGGKRYGRWEVHR